MIELTKLNNETILINPLQIEFVESIPESKITMMNGVFHIVIEDKDEITRRVRDFLSSVQAGVKREV